LLTVSSVPSAPDEKLVQGKGDVLEIGSKYRKYWDKVERARGEAMRSSGVCLVNRSETFGIKANVLTENSSKVGNAVS
jgi:hypothetical protein